MVTSGTWCKRMRSRTTLCIILIYDFLEDPTQIIAEPAGYFMAPIGEERIGDVSNVLFSNGWIEDDNGKVYIYYASSDTRLHVAESTVSQLVDYCLHTPTDGFRSIESVKRIITMVNHNKQYLKQ